MDAESSRSMSSQLRYPTIKGYRIGEEIGGGGFSKVFRAIDDTNCRVAACKVVNLFISPSIGYGTPDVKELQKEVQVHKSLTKPMKNEYILEFIHSEVVDKDKENEGWVPGLYIVLELAIGGDLFDKIAPDVGIPDDLANFYFAQLASGIDFIHQKGIAHRDLKPENLLLAANGNLKISDFGLCAVFKHKDKTRLLSGRCGSLPYVAPELGGPSGTGYKAEPVDIWGMGVVLYTMLCGNTPWDEPSENSPEFRAYLSGELLQYEPWTRLKGPALAMLLQLLTVNPDQRITMQQIKSHPWCMTASQLTRAQMGDALTAGMRSTGMMAIADPVFTSQASQAYATNRSQRMLSESQFASQLNAQESQFLRATGNITQAGDFNTITTRFWLSLDPSQSLELLTGFLRADLGEQGVQLIPRSNGGDIAVQKTAGAKSIAGTFQVRGSDSLMEAKTLVIMRRGKGSILHWKAFWWSVVRDKRLLPYVIKGE